MTKSEDDLWTYTAPLPSGLYSFAYLVNCNYAPNCSIDTGHLVIDPDVPKTAATFFFREVPCETAFRVVLRTYGLAAQSSPQVLEVLR